MKLPKLSLQFSKRQKFVVSALLLSVGMYINEAYTHDIRGIIFGIILSFVTVLFLYLMLREELKGSFHYLLFVLPFLFTLSFTLFNTLVPQRFISRIVLTGIYMLAVYSLFLSYNIFAVSSSKTINLLRSARVVAFVLTLIVLFFFLNVLFSLHLNPFVTAILVFGISFLLNTQSLFTYTLDKQSLPQIFLHSFFISLCLGELSLVLTIWPISATIYSIFLTGIFYTYSGLSHTWIERRLFKGVFWEYLWVGLLVILLLIRFAEWGI